MFSREAIAKIADSIRHSLALLCPYDPFRVVELLKGEIIHTIENMSIDAAIKKDGERSFIIHLNPYKSHTRERFTLAHELGHLFLHMGFLLNKELWNSIPEGQFQDSAYYRIDGNYTQEEHEANEFAAAFLMPKDEFIFVSKQHLNNNQYTISPIARHFEVSEISVINRGKWLGIFEWYPT
jgi:Zn-dependent peptidase ImmA (M78 family)